MLNAQDLQSRLNQLCGIDILEQFSTAHYVFYVEEGTMQQDTCMFSFFQTSRKKSTLQVD